MSRFNLKGILLGRCPRCLKGPLFLGGLVGFAGAMHEECRKCGLRFLRESGYFLGAMYVSYTLGIFTVLPVAILLAVVLDWPVAVVLVLMAVQTLVSVPIFMRISRAFWLYLDQTIDPR